MAVHALRRAAANRREKIDYKGLGQWDFASIDTAGFPGKAMFDVWDSTREKKSLHILLECKQKL